MRSLSLLPFTRTSHWLRKPFLAGKHVFVEKPLASQSGHAMELVEIASQKNLTLMVGHTFVYNPAVEGSA